MNADDRYVVISADCHGGGEIHEYRDFLAPKYHDEFDAWVDGVRDPVPGPPGRPRQAQLGLRPSPARPRGRRHRRRGHLPEHRSRRSSRRRARHAGRRPTDAHDLELRWAGLQAHNRWLADFCAARPAAAPASRRSCCTTSTRSVEEIRWAHDARAHRRHPAPGRAARHRAAAAAPPALRARSGRCARSSACR